MKTTQNIKNPYVAIKSFNREHAIYYRYLLNGKIQFTKLDLTTKENTEQVARLLNDNLTKKGV